MYSSIIVLILVVGVCLAVDYSDSSENRIVKIKLGKHNKHLGNPTRKGKVDVALYNDNNIYYYGWITVGTPGQKMRVNFDTGSSPLWLTSSELKAKNPDLWRKCRQSYNHTKSSTYKRLHGKFSIEYMDHKEYYGHMSRDNIEVEGITVKGQRFGEVTKQIITRDECNNQYDGIFGLSLARQNGLESPFMNMIEQRVVQQPVFAFYLNSKRFGPSGLAIDSWAPDHMENLSDSPLAELVLGGIDPNHFTGNITYTPVASYGSWMIKVEESNINGKRVCGSFNAVVDSGTTIVIAPHDIVSELYEVIGEDYDYHVENNVHVPRCKCSMIEYFPSVAFVINKRQFILEPQDYILKVDYNLCFIGIVSGQDQYLLGDVFMRKFYTVFDVGNLRVGFAQTK